MTVKYRTSNDKYVQFRYMLQYEDTTAGNAEFVNTDNWAVCDDEVLTDNPEYVEVKTDSEGKFLYGVKTNGEFFFGTGCPQQVKDYIQNKINELSLDEYEDIVSFLNGLEDGDKTLQELLNEKASADVGEFVEDSAYMQVETDKDGKILGGRKIDGTKFENMPTETPVSVSVYEDSAEWVEVKLDNDGKVICGINKNGEVVFGTLSSQINSQINSQVSETVQDELSKEISQIIIPDKLNAVVGDTLQVYFKSIINCPNYQEYGIVCDCSIGKSYPRYFEVTPVVGDVGEKTLTIYVYDRNMKVVTQKTIVLNVMSPATSPSSNKNILLVGASTFADGVIIPEVNRRFTNTDGAGTPASPQGLGLNNISFIGRKEVGGIHQEATGGYSWGTYATNALKMHRFYVSGVSSITLGATYTIEGVPLPSGLGYLIVTEINITEGTGNILCEVYGGAIYSSIPASGTLLKRSGTGDASISYSSTVEEDGNPFWYNDAVDFQHYSSAYCGGVNIDILITHLGLNGFSSKQRVDTQIENYAKPFIRKFHQDYPNGKVLLNTLQMGSPFGGYASLGYASSSQNWYNIADVYWYALEKYKELADSTEFSSYVILGSITTEFDCEYGYPTTNKSVNNRVTQTESMQTNQIHPTNQGKLLLADSIYRDLTQIFKNL